MPGRRRKSKGKAKRHNKGQSEFEPKELKNAPHSFVISRGKTGRFVNQLVLNFRKVMEPFTASSLQMKRSTVRDLSSVAGSLHVSHLCMFTHTDVGVYLRLANFPRGPTLTFRVLSYTLSRDVQNSLKRRLTYAKQYLHGALLIMSNFSASSGKHVQLTATMLQGLFPAINVNKVKLKDVRRAVLFSFDAESDSIEFRHYAIKLTPTGVSKSVKRLICRPQLPNLGRMRDMEEYIQRAVDASDSEADMDAAGTVELPQAVTSRGNMIRGQSAVGLKELGPRMTLQLVKAEDGLMAGKVLYHRFVSKTEQEIYETEKRLQNRAEEKKRRQAEQEKNVRDKALGGDVSNTERQKSVKIS